MRAFYHTVTRRYVLFLFLSLAAPEYEHKRLFARAELFYYAVGKRLPSAIAMRVRLSRTYGKSGVEEQNALLRPTRQIACGSAHVRADVGGKFLVNVYKRRRKLYSAADRKRKTVRLSGIYVRVLSDDNYFYILERHVTERRENKRTRRIYGIFRIFFFHEFFELREVRLVLFFGKNTVPVVSDFKFHGYIIAIPAEKCNGLRAEECKAARKKKLPSVRDACLAYPNRRISARKYAVVIPAAVAAPAVARKKSHDHHGIECARHSAPLALIVENEKHKQKKSENVAVIRHDIFICGNIRQREYIIIYL